MPQCLDLHQTIIKIAFNTVQPVIQVLERGCRWALRAVNVEWSRTVTKPTMYIIIACSFCYLFYNTALLAFVETFASIFKKTSFYLDFRAQNVITDPTRLRKHGKPFCAQLPTTRGFKIALKYNCTILILPFPFCKKA